ncbi:MAG TPA: hypothetical protein ENH85_06440 [Candidatus Scalindua sp.]|nr:hypothetical protein [Candidatus Scalindua sp.]
MEKRHERTCEVCGEKFLSSITYGKCCSDKCRVRRWRKTEKGKACVVRSNKRYKRLDIKKICVHCGKNFITARANQKFCSGCSKKQGAYYGHKKHRAKFPEKNRIRDRTNKIITRDKTLERQPCEVCGEENAEAHHYNYDHPLNINWLCKEHHGMEHKRLKVLQNI